MAVRAKFVVTSYETKSQAQLKETPREDGKPRSWSNHEDREKVECRKLKLQVVPDGDPESRKFFHGAPFGTIEIGMLSKTAWEQFELDGEMSVEFSPAQKGGVNGN